ncbi:MAG TPA: protease HtpX, partial [Acidobacteriota bacterium]|nr:protease HtpX [Acidobacteriota bacterium]
MTAIKTALLFGLMTALIMGVGYLVGGRQGIVFAFVIAAAMNFVSYWFSDKIVLAMYRAKPVDESQAPELYRIVTDLAQRQNIPMPRIYMIPTESPNAFATGRNPEHAVVA